MKEKKDTGNGTATMHATDVKGSCGAMGLPGAEGLPMGPFSGMMPYFKQVGLAKDKHSNKLRSTNGTLNFREMQLRW